MWICLLTVLKTTDLQSFSSEESSYQDIKYLTSEYAFGDVLSLHFQLVEIPSESTKILSRERLRYSTKFPTKIVQDWSFGMGQGRSHLKAYISAVFSSHKRPLEEIIPNGFSCLIFFCSFETGFYSVAHAGLVFSMQPRLL